MGYQVLTDVTLSPEILAMIGKECELHIWSESDPQIRDMLSFFDGVLLYGHEPKIDDPFLAKTPNMKVVSNIGVGVDHIDLEAANRRGIPVGNTPGAVAPATADMTFALMLAIARNFIAGYHFAKGPEFTHYDPTILLGRDVHGQTLGIVGLGQIGREVAKRARGFDMRVLYTKRNRDLEAEKELGVTHVSLTELLRMSDFVSLHVPLNDETYHMIGREELGLMKPTAYLVNMARGGVLDHQALLEVLAGHAIAGAALDVTEPEPLPRDHPLLSMENAIVLPHLGSAAVQTRLRMVGMAVDNLKAGLAGKPLPHPVG